MCHDHPMSLEVPALVAVDAGAYWLAGLLTVAASAIVVIVMLATSRIDEDESS